MKSPCVTCMNTEDRSKCSETCEALARYREIATFANDCGYVSPTVKEYVPYKFAGRDFYTPPYTVPVEGGYRKVKFAGAP